MIGKRCKATTKNGQPCNFYALVGDEYCFVHSPTKGAERAAARKRGGLNRSTRHRGNPANIPKKVRSLTDVLLVLDYVLQETVGLENGINRSRALTSLAEAYIKALEVSALEERINVLEKAYQTRKETT